MIPRGTAAKGLLFQKAAFPDTTTFAPFGDHKCTPEARHRLIVFAHTQEHDRPMAYGDNRPSSVQRNVAIAAIFLATLELSYSWLVSGMMASVPNTALTIVSCVLSTAVVGNFALIIGPYRPVRHWLRTFSVISIFMMIAVPTGVVLYVMAWTGS